jgi:polyvinyl alcohol dehydrogenase (cytochrome)
VSDTTQVSCERSRSSRHIASLRHIGATLAIVLLATATLVAGGSRNDASAPADDAIEEISVQQAAACVQATNSAHADAGRATRFLLFVWARGSNTYLGLVWATSALREGPAGTWTRVESCDTVPPTPTGWRTVGYDLGSSRAVLTEDTISPENINTLGRAWQTGNIEGFSGTPIVVEGTVYVGDWSGRVRALDAITGQERWAVEVGGESGPAPGGGSQITGSVAVDDTRVYVGTWDARLIALNRQNGTKLWEKDIDTHDLAVFYGSPVVVNGKVIVPVASDEWWEAENYNFRGSVAAFDAATGNELWRYWTSCGPENAGRNNCPAGAAEGPGVGVWAYPVVDLQRNLVYFGTGNQYERPTSGRSDSLIALDINTGQERWVRQFTAGDWWNLPALSRGDPELGPDADAMVASLFNVGTTPAAGVGDKGGTYHAVNRETGQVLWSTKLTNGSIQGGVMASATVVPGDRVGLDRDVIYVTSNRSGQGADLVVLDSTNGSILWRTDVGGSVVSPPTWANGLIYIADNTGRISAYHSTDLLRRVWSWKTPAPAASGIAVVDGMVYAGWGWALNGDSPNGGVIAYKLGGEPPDDEEPPPDGASIYSANCAACHGADGSGGAGPSLLGIGDAHSVEEITAVVTNGRGGMPAWREELTAEEIAAVVEYIRTFEGEHGHGEH